MRSRSSTTCALCITVAMVCLAACILPWKETIRATSPDGRATVIVLEQIHAADSSLRVVLKDQRGTVRLHSDDRDGWPGLTEVYWSSDAKVVGVLVCEPLHGDLVLGYDRARGQPIASAEARLGLMKNIRGRYQLSPRDLKPHNDDPLAWACNAEEASRLFQERFAEGKRLPAFVGVERPDTPSARKPGT